MMMIRMLIWFILSLYKKEIDEEVDVEKRKSDILMIVMIVIMTISGWLNYYFITKFSSIYTILNEACPSIIDSL